MHTPLLGLDATKPCHGFRSIPIGQFSSACVSGITPRCTLTCNGRTERYSSLLRTFWNVLSNASLGLRRRHAHSDSHWPRSLPPSKRSAVRGRRLPPPPSSPLEVAHEKQKEPGALVLRPFLQREAVRYLHTASRSRNAPYSFSTSRVRSREAALLLLQTVHRLPQKNTACSN